MNNTCFCHDDGGGAACGEQNFIHWDWLGNRGHAWNVKNNIIVDLRQEQDPRQWTDMDSSVTALKPVSLFTPLELSLSRVVSEVVSPLNPSRIAFSEAARPGPLTPAANIQWKSPPSHFEHSRLSSHVFNKILVPVCGECVEALLSCVKKILTSPGWSSCHAWSSLVFVRNSTKKKYWVNIWRNSGSGQRLLRDFVFHSGNISTPYQMWCWEDLEPGVFWNIFLFFLWPWLLLRLSVCSLHLWSFCFCFFLMFALIICNVAVYVQFAFCPPNGSRYLTVPTCQKSVQQEVKRETQGLLKSLKIDTCGFHGRSCPSGLLVREGINSTMATEAKTTSKAPPSPQMCPTSEQTLLKNEVME